MVVGCCTAPPCKASLNTTQTAAAHLHHILPLQHAVGVSLEAPRVHGVADQEAEVGLKRGTDRDGKAV